MTNVVHWCRLHSRLNLQSSFQHKRPMHMVGLGNLAGQSGPFHLRCMIPTKKVQCLVHFILLLNKGKAFLLSLFATHRLQIMKASQEVLWKYKRHTFTKAYICSLFRSQDPKTQCGQDQGEAYRETKRGFSKDYPWIMMHWAPGELETEL